MDARRSVAAEVEDLQRAIDGGAAVGLGEEHLAPAREAVGAAPTAAAQAVLQHAHNTLNLAIGNEQNVDAELGELLRAIDAGDRAGVNAVLVADAREAVREAQRVVA